MQRLLHRCMHSSLRGKTPAQAWPKCLVNRVDPFCLAFEVRARALAAIIVQMIKLTTFGHFCPFHQALVGSSRPEDPPSSHLLPSHTRTGKTPCAWFASSRLEAIVRYSGKSHRNHVRFASQVIHAFEQQIEQSEREAAPAHLTALIACEAYAVVIASCCCMRTCLKILNTFTTKQEAMNRVHLDSHRSLVIDDLHRVLRDITI
eukprot:6187939-Pleurochrysis_carterae.AAC.2